MEHAIRTAYFERFSLDMTLQDAKSASHMGRCDEDVAALVADPAISAQLDEIPAEDLSAELRMYAAWSDEELQDNEANRRRIVWLAAGDIVEEEYRESTEEDQE